MKYYKLGYRKHFKFVVRADVGISTVKSFYSPSRWWAKLAIRWRLYKLNIVRSSDMVALDLTGEEAILIKGNDAENQVFGKASGGISNPEIRWEKQKTLDIGIDLRILDNKIDITADYFKKRTEDLFYESNHAQYDKMNK